MLKRARLSSASSLLLLCLLLVLVSACDLPGSGSSGSSTPTATHAMTNSPTVSATPQTVPMPATDTSCPAADTARPAVMRTLVRAQLQNLIYIYNEVPQNTSTAVGHLRRYDVSNGHKAEIISSGIRIDQAQISADGQWVLFLSIPDPRGDSYCFPATTYSNTTTNTSRKLPISIQWSVDQKSILISESTNSALSKVFLLDVTTGSISQLFLDQKDTSYYYSVVTWLDNTHFYLIKQGLSAPTPPATVYLVDASKATVTTPGLVKILTTTTRMSFYSLDSSYDGTLLYSSYCSQAGGPFSTNIQVGPSIGGTRHTIYQEQPKDCIQSLRAISASKLLLLMQIASGNGIYKSQIWIMDLLSNSPTTVATLTSTNSGQTGYSLNPTTQYTWSNISRDSSFYALQAIDPVANNQTILVGPLKGGDLTAVAVTNPGNSTVSLAGWTTL